MVEKIESASWVDTSGICQLEFLGFENLSQADRQLFAQFMSRIEVIKLESPRADLMSAIAEIRSQRNLKLPDAIVAVSSQINHARLLTRDSVLLKARHAVGWPTDSF